MCHPRTHELKIFWVVRLIPVNIKESRLDGLRSASVGRHGQILRQDFSGPRGKYLFSLETEMAHECPHLTRVSAMMGAMVS
jgi:hypothetical protein